MENNEPKTQQAAPQAQEQADIVTRVKANKNRLITIGVAILAVIVAILVWFFIDQQGSRKADEAIAKADIEVNDSVALQLYKEAAEMGHKSGNRAKLEVAIALYQDGKYEEALGYLEDASISDKIVKAGAYSLTGDCYVNLNKYPEALKAYDKAISAADENPSIVPVFLFKKANIYRAEKNYEEEYKALKEIADNYPAFGKTGYQDSFTKYYERAKAAAGK